MNSLTKTKVYQRRNYKRQVLLLSLLLLLGGAVMSVSSINAVTNDDYQYYQSSSQYDAKGRFKNTETQPDFSLSKSLGFIKRAIFEKKVNTQPSVDIPLEQLTQQQILTLPNEQTSIVRLGHSTLLLKVANQLWLIDPVFGERASPFSFIGPKRFHQPPISIEDLPAIDGVIISHNHYDHLDELSIKQLHQRVKHFVLPLGNGTQLMEWGVDKEKITELDWWQNYKVGELEIVATPSQHFSGRGLTDSNRTLWSSWVIKSPQSNLFYSGDTGYFSGFKEIGEKYGPFDLTMMETGAYDKDWPEVHMTPQQSVQAHLDVKGKKMIPVHNGTFDLAFHSWTDPFEQVDELAKRHLVDLLTPKMGQVVSLNDENQVNRARDNYWWRIE